jgi:hypothetical protein
MPPDSGGIQRREPRAKLLVSSSFAPLWWWTVRSTALVSAYDGILHGSNKYPLPVEPKLRTRQRFPNIAGCDTSMSGERYRGPLGPTELAPTRALKPRRLAREKVAYQQRCAPLAWVGRYALALLEGRRACGPCSARCVDR